MDRVDQETGYRLAELRVPKGDDFLSREELAKLTPAIVIERVRKLKPAFRAHALEAEKLRRPVDWLWAELRKTGYFYLMVPKKYGGLEASVDELIDASLPICEGDAAVGWTAMFGMTHNRNAANMPPEGQDELFGKAGGKYIVSPGMTLPLGHAVKVPGGYRVTGHWKWATCAHVSDWHHGLCNIDTPEGPQVAGFMMPSHEVRVLDTWDADGMIATGTHDVVVKDLFVPDSRVNTRIVRDGTGPGSKMYDYPLYRVPLSPLLALAVAVPVVGCARAAVEIYEERLKEHTKRGTDVRQGDKPASQMRLAKADTMVESAAILVRNAANENMKGIGLSNEAQFPMRAKLRAQITYAASLCRQAVIMICESTGTSIHYVDHPLQKLLRDMMVATSHIVFDDDVCMEQHGRARMGLPPNSVII